MKKCHITLMCGGQSCEHDISILSAGNVLKGLQRKCYDVSVVYIQRSGQWLYFDAHTLAGTELAECLRTQPGDVVSLIPGEPSTPWLLMATNQRVRCDCVFPMLHGTSGEDGAIQGLLQMLGVPFVGADVLGSVVCFAKDLTKAVLYSAGIQTVPFIVLTKQKMTQYTYQDLVKLLGEKMVVKPSSQGSSVGVSMVISESTYQVALANAFLYDRTVLVERAIEGREVECGVLGTTEPITATLGEVISPNGVYSYDEKYGDSSKARQVVPPEIPEHLQQRIQNIAKNTYKALHCVGMARVDFFVTEDEEIFVNEVNTIPGFTEISLFPKTWEASGMPLPELLDQLIKDALDFFQLLAKKRAKQTEIRLRRATDEVYTS